MIAGERDPQALAALRAELDEGQARRPWCEALTGMTFGDHHAAPGPDAPGP